MASPRFREYSEILVWRYKHTEFEPDAESAAAVPSWSINGAGIMVTCAYIYTE